MVALLQGPALAELRAHHGERQVLIRAVAVDLAERHGLDEGEVVAFGAAPGDEILDLVLVDAAQGHGVDLDPEAGGAGRVDARHHLAEPAPARDLGELVGIARVEGDVHPAHARGVEPLRMARQLAAVGGERELVERAASQVAAQALEEADDALAHERLAAGDAELAHAQPHEGAAQAIQLLQRQQLRLGQEAHVLRHAIDAAEVAAIGDGDAKIGDVALERVDQHGFHSAGARRLPGRTPRRILRESARILPENLGTIPAASTWSAHRSRWPAVMRLRVARSTRLASEGAGRIAHRRATRWSADDGTVLGPGHRYRAVSRGRC